MMKENKKNNNIKKKDNDKNKMKDLKKIGKKNKSKQYRMIEYLFIGFSIYIIILIIAIYTYRAFYYYNRENYVGSDTKLVDVIFNPIKVIYSGDGLYKNSNNDEYYFYGKSVNNYLIFNGRLWRIIGLDDNGIKLITNDNQTSLIWGNGVNFDESKIYDWLNKDVFVNTIDDKNMLVNGKYCNEFIDINNYKCDKNIESLVGLLSTNEYLRAGGVNSYLNINSYFWTLNISNDMKAYYVHNNGGLNNDISHNDSLYSYGVRPVIYISKDIVYISGNGTKEEPYIVGSNNDVKIGNHYVGDYVLYNGYKFRIMSKNDEFIKLILDGYIIDGDGDKIKKSYNNVRNYLNDNFISEFNKDELVKTKFLYTLYNSSNNYDYKEEIEEVYDYVGIPNISDMFVSNYSDNWLNTYNNRGQGLVYKTTDNSSVMADLVSEENYIRCVISISFDLIISGGNGTENDPYRIGDNK